MFCCILYKYQIISEFFDFLGYLLFEGDVFSKKNIILNMQCLKDFLYLCTYLGANKPF